MLVGGNLAFVRDETQRTLAIGDVVQTGLSDNPYAEAYFGVNPHWYVATVEPGRERAAAGSLSGNRFAVYLPEATKQIIRRGRPVRLNRPLCPGYIFVFVWDMTKHASRVLACVGVRGILRMGDDPSIDSPYAIIPDEIIDRMRAVENRENPFIQTVEQITLKRQKRGRNNRKSPRYTETKTREEVVTCDEIVSIRCWSALADVDQALDGPERNQAFRRRLASSNTCSMARLVGTTVAAGADRRANAVGGCGGLWR